ncbi:DUF6361 family protein [Nodosilinea sp. FACHB-13]|uniref:DUF6361 family protein n=1 Tax=Cyanophyceae TaxID=3028117 RepID=UPI001689DDF4|nr:DUF6361 family protein [Nodosilinea sp. FACHB-13]MBD2109301.1 hypothetical protein [Nodosilinea sp. FACHB-13]
MASSFTWLDYSEQDRRKMLDVISLFREQTTRDELGIGAIRDAFANLFFPGVSTIQTRARYFLFIPWVYQDLVNRKTTSQQVDGKLRQQEVALINILAESADKDGTIGKVSRAALKRLPSSIYWYGLGSWGIYRYGGSQQEYHQAFDRLNRSSRRTQHNDDGDILSLQSTEWDPHLPQAPADFPASASFRLTAEEAEYLADRIAQRHPRSLLAHLVRQSEPSKSRFPWQHPAVDSLPPDLQEQLLHAQNFSELIHGAALLYNLMLAEAKPDATLAELYRTDLQQWATQLSARVEALQGWNRQAFWQLVNQQAGPVRITQSFVNYWFDLALDPDSAFSVADNAAAKALIHDREVALKGQQARLDNPRALELWLGNSGALQLNFRWPTVSKILNDVLTGLAQQEADYDVAA